MSLQFACVFLTRFSIGGFSSPLELSSESESTESDGTTMLLLLGEREGPTPRRLRPLDDNEEEEADDMLRERSKERRRYRGGQIPECSRLTHPLESSNRLCTCCRVHSSATTVPLTALAVPVHSPLRCDRHCASRPNTGTCVPSSSRRWSPAGRRPASVAIGPTGAAISQSPRFLCQKHRPQRRHNATEEGEA